MTDTRYWLWLSLAFKQGSSSCDTLMQSFHYNPKAIFEADPAALTELVGAQNVTALNSLRNFSRVDRIYEYCQKENIGLLTPDSKFYPSSLLRITGQPPVIYYKGRLPDFSSRPTVGVVGTRNVTPYGRSAAYTISHDLASAGAVVVSGMAIGTDTAAHRGALDAKGMTVAFLGCGIDVVYPRENIAIMKEISENGAVMTDYPPGDRPEGWHFPLRNRLISGVSHGVLVIEAAMKSGALITAEHAVKQGKLIYAVPGKVGELASTGTNNLIRQGAKMVTNSGDILSDFKGLFGDGLKSNHTQMQNEYDNIHERSSVLPPSYTTPQPPKTANVFRTVHPNITYQGTPTPENGYTVIISEEDIKKYSEFGKPKTERTENVATETLYNHVNALRALRKANSAISKAASELAKASSADEFEAEMKKVVSYDKPKTKAPQKPDLDGLNENEVKIINYLFENGRSSTDGLSSLDIPFPVLLASLTALEIKGSIAQTAGGYFSLK